MDTVFYSVPGPFPKDSRFYPYLASVALVGILTFVDGIFHSQLGIVGFTMLHFLSVVVSALYLGRGPAVVTVILNVLAYDYFVLPPSFAFAINLHDDVIAFFGLLAVGFIISELTSKVKRQAFEANEREMRAVTMRETEKLQTALLNSVSHDLRTPLVSITGALSGLLEDPEMKRDSDRLRLLRGAYDESVKLNRLVGGLLSVSRAEAGALRIDPEPCDLRDLARTAFESLADKLESKNVRLMIPADFPPVPMDYSLMLSVFTNLVENAAKYTGSGAKIEIEAREEGKNVVIEVRDDGPGIPEEEIGLVFDKFYRLKRNQRVSGSGLGLYICRAIVEAHGGRISVRNGSPGAVFTVQIPRKEIR